MKRSVRTAVEYAIMVAAIAALLITIVLVIGRQTFASFRNQSDSMAQTRRFGGVDASADCGHLR